MNENNGNIRFLSAISYIGVLFVIGHFAVEKNNPDLRFHTYQGGFLFFCFSVLYFLDFLLYLALSFSSALQTVLIFLLTTGLVTGNIILSVMGIIAAVHFEQKMLPYIGKPAVNMRIWLDNWKNRT